MDEIYTKLIELMKKQVKKKNFDFSQLTPETNLTKLGLDSLDTAELVINIEEEFSLPEITQDEMMELKTVKDVHDLVENKKN